MSKYIIGIDGGGTSTDGALFDLDGTILKTYQSGFANFRVHPDVAKDNVTNTINQLVDGHDLNDILFIQIGVAGIPNEQERQALEREWSDRYQTPVSIVADALIALYSIRRESDTCVVMVLGGTGSAIMIGDQHNHQRIGGYGHLLGDEGSAYHLAITAIKRIIQQFEQGDPITSLSKAILHHLHATEPAELKDYVYSHTKQDIAHLSRFIGEHATNGNPEAIELFEEEGKLLAHQTLLALKKVPHCDHVVIGFRGSFLLDAPRVKEVLVQELEQQHVSYIIDEHPVDPVVGAYYLGLNQSKTR